MVEAHKYTVAIFVLAAVSLSQGAANAAPPVPFYGANVTGTDKISGSSVIITTADSVDAVCAWYRKNLQDRNGETTITDGAHIYYTHNGATVDVEPGNRLEPGTTIGLVWDARKFGTYSRK